VHDGASTDVDVTVIVIAHDVREEVLRCLASIEAHHGALTVETILVDNGSADGTSEAVSERFPGTRIVRLAENIGVPARNEGLRRARGRHRMFLDSDAELTPDALEGMVSILDSEPQVGLVGPRLTDRDGTLQLSARRFPPRSLPFLRRPPLERFLGDSRPVRHHLMADETHDRRRRVEYVLGACQLFRANAQSAAGEIDTKIFYGHDDADWCFRIREAGFDVVYAPDFTVIHDYRRSTAANPVSALALRYLLAFIHFQRKWRGSRRRLIAEGREMDREAS
jgi:GT2 family glycosyltransferase